MEWRESWGPRRLTRPSLTRIRGTTWRKDEKGDIPWGYPIVNNDKKGFEKDSKRDSKRDSMRDKLERAVSLVSQLYNIDNRSCGGPYSQLIQVITIVTYIY